MNPLHLVAICLASLVYSVNGAKNAKRGLAFAESVYKTDIKQVNTTKSVISWQYDWGQSPPSYLTQSNIPYVPMQWGTNGESNFSSLVKQQGIKIALVCRNEFLSSHNFLLRQGHHIRDLTSQILEANRILRLRRQQLFGRPISTH